MAWDAGGGWGIVDMVDVILTAEQRKEAIIGLRSGALDVTIGNVTFRRRRVGYQADQMVSDQRIFGLQLETPEGITNAVTFDENHEQISIDNLIADAVHILCDWLECRDHGPLPVDSQSPGTLKR